MADAGRKQLEQLMHQLQEQLQINLLQQTHLMQTNSNTESNKGGGTKTSQAMQQLQIQQQQLISQLQLVQQRLLMVSKPHQKSNIDCEIAASVHCTVQWCIGNLYFFIGKSEDFKKNM